ncbi:hypothetical protein M8Q33_02245 [Enterobacter hormaechei]|nr:hypothetical protein [Enterobacter hormaechei]HAV1557597.1 hypothetical protein [Enterobacter hormaechei subsp. steigerwaltii]
MSAVRGIITPQKNTVHKHSIAGALGSLKVYVSAIKKVTKLSTIEKSVGNSRV